MRQIYLTFLLALMLFPAVALSQTDFEATKALAEQGLADAQYKLGFLYADGQGVPQNYAEAEKWIRLAAEQGNAEAQSSLGRMYAGGQVVPQNYAEAFKWFRLAAEQGNPGAQYNLVVMYADGKGVPRNTVMAYVWSSVAAAQGDDGARNNRDVFAGRLTPDQLARGQDIATRCFASGYKDCD